MNAYACLCIPRLKYTFWQCRHCIARVALFKTLFLLLHSLESYSNVWLLC